MMTTKRLIRLAGCALVLASCAEAVQPQQEMPELRLSQSAMEAEFEHCYLASDGSDELVLVDRFDFDTGTNEETIGDFGAGEIEAPTRSTVSMATCSARSTSKPVSSSPSATTSGPEAELAATAVSTTSTPSVSTRSAATCGRPIASPGAT